MQRHFDNNPVSRLVPDCGDCEQFVSECFQPMTHVATYDQLFEQAEKVICYGHEHKRRFGAVETRLIHFVQTIVIFKSLDTVLTVCTLTVENGCIISKGADIIVAFRVELPELFTVTSGEYEIIHSSLDVIYLK